MIIENYTSQVNANVFLREFSFDKNKFNLTPAEEVEFADHVIWIDDLMMIFQLKQRESCNEEPEHDENRWFTKKVLGKATRQIRDSLRYLYEQPKIKIQNQRGHTFTLNPQSLSTIIKIILYSSGNDPSMESPKVRYHESRTAGFIHILPLHEYLNICGTFITPAEITNYFIFRERLLGGEVKDIEVSESAFVGQYLADELDCPPSEQYSKYYRAFLNTVDEFDISSFLEEMVEHIDFGKSTIGETDYYPMLAEFSKLTRAELREIKTRMRLCLDASRGDQYRRPYMLAVPDHNCTFVFIPIPHKLIKYRFSALINLTHAAMYDRRLEKGVGISFAYEDKHFLIDWAYAKAPWVENTEMEEWIKSNQPFRKLNLAKPYTYFLKADDL